MGLTLLKSLGDHIVDAVQNIVGTLLWGLSDIFFVIINLCETLFRKFAGLDVASTESGEKIEGDIVLFLLQENIVQEIFFSILILSFFLLIIFTIFAIVKNQYVEKPKPVMNIINASVKGLLQYLMVPVCVVVGLAVGNVILQAVDGATKGAAESASGMLFKSAAYNANKVRNGSITERREELIELLEDDKLVSIYTLQNGDGVAEILHASANKNSLIKAARLAPEPELDRIALLIDEAYVSGLIINGNTEDIYNPVEVFEFYEALSISYITIWVGGAFLCYCLIMITWGLLGRIFKMVISYVLTPALIAMYPMDDGKGLKSWIGYFSKEATMAYCAVAVVNVFYSILPFVKSIRFFDGLGFFDSITQLLIVISGYMLVKSFIATVSGWFGTGDAYAAGAATKADIGKGFKNVTGKIAGASTKTIGTFAGLKGGWQQAGDVGKNKFFGALTGAYKGAGLDAKFDPTKVGKAWKDGQKSGGDYYKQVKTSHMYDKWNKENQAKFDYADLMDKEKKAYLKEAGIIDKTLEAEIEAVNNDSSLSDAEKTNRIAQLREGAEKMKAKKRSESTAAKILTAGEEALLEKDQKALEKRQRYVSPAESMYRAKSSIENYILGDAKDDLSQAEIDSAIEFVKSGDMSKLKAMLGSKDAQSAMDRYDKYSEQIVAQENVIADAFDTAFEMASTDNKALAELEKVFTFQKQTLDDGSQEVVGIVKNLVQAADNYKDVARDLKKSAADLEKRSDDLKRKKSDIGGRAFDDGLSATERAAVEKGVPKQ